MALKSWRDYLKEVELAEDKTPINQDPGAQEIMKRPNLLVPSGTADPAAALKTAQKVIRTTREKNVPLEVGAKAVGLTTAARIPS